MEKIFSTYSKIENPSMEMVLFTFVLSFLLACLIAFTYEKTTQNSLKNYGAIQAFILSSTVATMILQAIGDNIGAGLAMLGALTVVQFRTKLASPRESVFMFASLGVGISCGLYGFFVALVGGLFFCAVAFLIRFSPFHFSHLSAWDLRLKLEEATRLSPQFENMMNTYCSFWTLESLSPEKEKKEKDEPGGAPTRACDYRMLLRDESKLNAFLLALADLRVQILALDKKNKAQ